MANLPLMLMPVVNKSTKFLHRTAKVIGIWCTAIIYLLAVPFAEYVVTAFFAIYRFFFSSLSIIGWHNERLHEKLAKKTSNRFAPRKTRAKYVFYYIAVPHFLSRFSIYTFAIPNKQNYKITKQMKATINHPEYLWVRAILNISHFSTSCVHNN